MSYWVLLTFVFLNPLKDFNTTLRLGPLDWYNLMYIYIIVAWFFNPNTGWIKTSVNKYFLIFIGFFIFSYFRGFAGPYPGDPIETLQDLKTIVTEIFLFFVFLNFIKTRRQMHLITVILAVVMIYESWVVINQYFEAVGNAGGGGFSWNLKSKITGTFLVKEGFSTASANEVGAFFALYTPFLIGYALGTDNKKVKTILFGLAVLFVFPLVFSFSRGGWIAFVISLSLYFLRKNKRLLIVFIIFLIISAPLLPSAVVERGSGISDNSATSRIDYWIESLGAMTNIPYFIAGIGFNQAGDYIGHDAHNSYIRVMLEFGIFGLAIFIILFFNISRLLNQIYVDVEEDPVLRAFLLGCILAFNSFIILNLVGTRMYNGAVAATLWAFLGTAIKAGIIKEEESFSESELYLAHNIEH